MHHRRGTRNAPHRRAAETRSYNDGGCTRCGIATPEWHGEDTGRRVSGGRGERGKTNTIVRTPPPCVCAPRAYREGTIGMTTLPPLPASNILIGGRTLLLLPTLVALVGLNEAIVLQQVRYRLGDDLRPQVRDGRRWARDPLDRWRERDFPFWEIDTVRRAFQSLEQRGLLRAEQFDKHLRDRTKWYTIDFEALAQREREHHAARRGSPPPRVRAAKVPGAQQREQGTPEEPLPVLPSSDLLIDEPPLVIVVRLAVVVGLDEALLLQQIRYWLADERRPHVRDGQRWVSPREVDLFAPLAFRSQKTIARALRSLEGRGLLHSSERYNRLPGDRTKWYTIDFERVATLPATPEGQNATIKRDKTPSSNETESTEPARQNPDILEDQLPVSSGPQCADQATILPASLKDSETDREINRREQQEEIQRDVVVTGLPNDRLEQALIERGITPTVAYMLVRQHRSVLEYQLDVFDWIRECDPDDAHLTPGRLRKMVEENWAAPRGHEPRQQRDERAAAIQEQAWRAERERVVSTTALLARDEQTREVRRALLAQLGLREEDQGPWSNAIVAAEFPGFLREALFYPPTRESAIAAIIFPHAPLAARAKALPSAVRTKLARRIASWARIPLTELWFCDQAEVRALLQTPTDGRIID